MPLAPFYSQLLEEFPKLEPCYETAVYKKVYDADISLAIPEGKKCYLWFTEFDSNDGAFLLFLDEKDRRTVKCINDVKQVDIEFHNKLSYGSVFYGTLFNVDPQLQFYCVEDVYWYKGKNISDMVYGDKLDTLKTFLKDDIKQDEFNPDIILGLPFMHSNFLEVIKQTYAVPYNVSAIQFRWYNTRKVCTMKYTKNENVKCNERQDNGRQDNGRQDNGRPENKPLVRSVVFKVCPDVQNDIYHLYYTNDRKETYYDIAYIPNYVTSVMMNKLFRTIKENNNLDALEESDDEEEFENVNEDKFVFLDRVFKMHCQYNAKFGKWFPVSLADDITELTTQTELDKIMVNRQRPRQIHRPRQNVNRK